MKRIIFIIIGIITVLFARELTFIFAPDNLDTEFYLLNIISFISFGNILCILGIFYPFKNTQNKKD